MLFSGIIGAQWASYFGSIHILSGKGTEWHIVGALNRYYRRDYILCEKRGSWGKIFTSSLVGEYSQIPHEQNASLSAKAHNPLRLTAVCRRYAGQKQGLSSGDLSGKLRLWFSSIKQQPFKGIDRGKLLKVFCDPFFECCYKKLFFSSFQTLQIGD